MHLRDGQYPRSTPKMCQQQQQQQLQGQQQKYDVKILDTILSKLSPLPWRLKLWKNLKDCHGSEGSWTVWKEACIFSSSEHLSRYSSTIHLIRRNWSHYMKKSRKAEWKKKRRLLDNFCLKLLESLELMNASCSWRNDWVWGILPQNWLCPCYSAPLHQDSHYQDS